MTYLTIVWALATPLIIAFGVCVMDRIYLYDYHRPSVNVLAALGIFVPIWWFIYCLIRLGTHT